MFAFVTGCTLAVAWLVSFADLPALSWSFVALAALPLLYFSHVLSRFVSGFLLFFSWSLFLAYQILSYELPIDLERQDLVVTGTIDSMPDERGENSRFVFLIDAIDSPTSSTIKFPLKSRISWYGRHPPMMAGERWRLTVRLKRPNGFMNPGGFDFEGWLFQQRIRATGYVRQDEHNERISEVAWGIEPLRQTIRDSMRQHLEGAPQVAVLVALAIGDQKGIGEDAWRVFTNTGTNHLVAVSGMHITLMAGIGFFLFRFLWSYAGRLPLYIPAPKAAALLSLLPAGIYAALAGMTVPTQRALIMTTVVMLSLMASRRFRPLSVLAVAWVLVLAIDPFAILSAGFWLSFVAVAVIFYAMLTRTSQEGWWWKWGYAQWIVTVGLMPVLIALFQQVPLVSPFANFFAIPWVSFIVTPLALLGAVLLPIFPWLADGLLWAGAYAMQGAWLVLEQMASWDWLLWHQHEPAGWTLLFAAIGVIWMVTPKGMPARWVGAVLCLPMLLVKPAGPEYGDAWVTLLDIGQGLAAVVRTHNNVLVYDTGSKTSETFDSGEAVIVPFLRSQGIQRIDTLLVSHGDMDHRGGTDSILESIPVTRLVTSIPQTLARAPDAPCNAGEQWQWDGIDFSVIHPRSDDEGKDNNLSCVLRVSDREGSSVLLTGDIEAKAERELIERYGEGLRADAMLVPHHGSKTSSTDEFLDTIKPRIAMNSAGYNNRYGFPKEEIVERYIRHGISFWNTAQTGALTLFLNGQQGLTVEAYRPLARKFWHSNTNERQ